MVSSKSLDCFGMCSQSIFEASRLNPVEHSSFLMVVMVYIKRANVSFFSLWQLFNLQHRFQIRLVCEGVHCSHIVVPSSPVFLLVFLLHELLLMFYCCLKLWLYCWVILGRKVSLYQHLFCDLYVLYIGRKEWRIHFCSSISWYIHSGAICMNV